MTDQDLVLAALQWQSPADRAAFLERACAGDRDLLERVEVMLRRAQETEGATRTPSPTPSDDPGPAGAPLSLAFLAPPGRPDSLGRLDHYEILEVIGRGGMGVVLRAFDEKLRRVVAVKVLAPELAASASARQRFARAARAAAAIRDQHVVAVYDIGEAPVPYLVMEHVRGQTLQQRLARDGPLSPAAVLTVALQAARALAAAHAHGLVHRDVKPGNILLENGTDRARLGDFGLARAADDVHMTQTGTVAGTPLYMSPEQAEGREVDHRSDLFSLGSVLYAACTAAPPFPAPNSMAVLVRVVEDAPRPIRQVNPAVPRWLEKVIARLMSKDADRRYRSAAEVAEVLAGHQARLQEGGGGRRVRSRRFRGALAVAGLLAVLGGAATYLALRPGGEPAGWRPRPPLTAVELADLPSPLDGQEGAELPPALRRIAGWGSPALASPTWVASLGRPPFDLPQSNWTHWPAWSPDGRLIAVPSAKCLLLMDARSGQLVRTLSWPDGTYRACFSPDGKRIVAGTDFDARVWDVASGREELRLTGHKRNVWIAVFSPDGRQIAASGQDPTIKVWDAVTGRELHTLDVDEDSIGHLAFSPDGKKLVSNGKVARVWDTSTGKELAILRDQVGRFTHLAFRPDGKVLAMADAANVILWDTETWQPIRTFPTSTPGSGLLAFTPDGKTLLTAREFHDEHSARQFCRWDAVTGMEKARLPLPGKAGWLGGALSADGRTVCFLSTEGPVTDGKHRLAIYDAETGQELPSTDRNAGLVGAVAVSPDGKVLAGGTENGGVRLWDLAAWVPGEPPPCRVLEGHAGAVLALVFSPDGATLASAGKDGNVVLRDAADGRKRWELAGACAEAVPQLAFSPDGKVLGVGQKDGVLAR
jgi:WD40 repeat protein